MAIRSAEMAKLSMSDGVRLALGVMRGGQESLVEQMGAHATESLYFRWPAGLHRLLRVSEGIFVVADPADAKTILVHNHDGIAKETRDFRIIREFLGGALIPLPGGVHWWERRKLLMPTFSHARVTDFGGTIVEEAKKSLHAWEKEITPKPLHPELVKLTLRVITNFMFGENLDDRTIQTIGQHITTLAHYTSERVSRLGYPPKWLPSKTNRIFRHALSELHGFLGTMYDRRQKTPGASNDMFTVLMSAQDAETTKTLTRQEVLDESLSMLIAGHETTANALTWSFYLLSRHPEVQRAVSQEIQQVLGDRDPTVGDLKNLKLVDWTLKEALRLYPPVWVFSRKTKQTITFDDGRQIPPKIFVAILPWLIHRNARYWKNPEEFNPSRFNPMNPDRGVKDAFIPFGVGQRRCLGADLAFTEASLVLATFLKHHRVDIGHAVEPALLISTRPKTPVLTSFVPIAGN